MSATAPARMTADEFIAWAMERPEGEHYELVAGEVVSMAPERVAHGRTKFRVARRLAEAIEAGQLDCEVLGDGMTVQVDPYTTSGPDSPAPGRPPLDHNGTRVFDRLILVEVVSPSSRARD